MQRLIVWEYSVKLWLWHKLGWWSVVLPLIPAAVLYGYSIFIMLADKKHKAAPKENGRA